jgi:hypothetical protein
MSQRQILPSPPPLMATRRVLGPSRIGDGDLGGERAYPEYEPRGDRLDESSTGISATKCVRIEPSWPPANTLTTRGVGDICHRRIVLSLEAERSQSRPLTEKDEGVDDRAGLPDSPDRLDETVALKMSFDMGARRL